MAIAPHLNAQSDKFPGDSTPQPPFGLLDSIRSLAIYSVGIPHFTAWTAFVLGVSRFMDLKHVDKALKLMSKAVPRLAGIEVSVLGQEAIDPARPYVFVANHVNIFDMFTLYQAIPQFTRSLELAEHFSWPVFGSFISAVGQIPVDPENPRITAKGLKKAAQMLLAGDSIVVLPEGERTLDGSVGHFYKGAFRLAVKTKVEVVPIAISGGRTVSRRGDWRVRPGKIEVVFGAPVSTEHLTLGDADFLAGECRQIIIDLLQKRRQPAAINQPQ